MITIKDKKLSISKKEAEKLAVYAMADATYNDLGSELSFKSNYVTGKGFRLVHNGVTDFVLIEGTEKSKTSTIYTVVEFDTEKEALEGIVKLGLIDPTQSQTKKFAETAK